MDTRNGSIVRLVRNEIDGISVCGEVIHLDGGHVILRDKYGSESRFVIGEISTIIEILTKINNEYE